jgi:hypothetical protein
LVLAQDLDKGEEFTATHALTAADAQNLHGGAEQAYRALAEVETQWILWLHVKKRCLLL